LRLPFPEPLAGFLGFTGFDHTRQVRVSSSSVFCSLPSWSDYLDGNGPTAVAYLAERLGIPLMQSNDPNAAWEEPKL
jgi:hypothetical protein